MSLLDESLVISTELGMHPSMERGRSRLEQPPSSAGTAWLCEQSDLLRIGKTHALFKLRTAVRYAGDLGQRAACQGEDAGHKAPGYLLRRAANLPLREVASLAGVLPSRVSHMQRQMEQSKMDDSLRQLIQMYKVKN